MSPITPDEMKEGPDTFSLHNIRPGHPLLNENDLSSKAKSWLKILTDTLNAPVPAGKTRVFTKENCENAIKGLFGIAKDRQRLRTPILNSLKQWVDDNHDNSGVGRSLYRHNVAALKKGFGQMLKEPGETRPYDKMCIRAFEVLTRQDPSEFREMQKQVLKRKKEAASMLSIAFSSLLLSVCRTVSCAVGVMDGRMAVWSVWVLYCIVRSNFQFKWLRYCLLKSFFTMNNANFSFYPKSPLTSPTQSRSHQQH